MDILKLYNDHAIPFVTEGKNYSSGWLNTNCPFCNDTSGHLGFKLDEGYFHCWKCGHHFPDQTIAKLLNITETEARILLKQYNSSFSISDVEPVKEIRVKSHKLPSGTMPLQANHKTYLEKRNFDPDFLEQEWRLLGTGPISKLDELDFKHRLIIPIIWDRKQVSFTARDITDKHKLKYLTCPKDRELIFHKSIIYGKQEYWKKAGICVEGPTDVWKMGRNSFCTFGIKYTQMQVRKMADLFRRIVVMFDNEPQAQSQADKLVAELRFRGVDAKRIECPANDPGSMKQEEADYLAKQLIK